MTDKTQNAPAPESGDPKTVTLEAGTIIHHWSIPLKLLTDIQVETSSEIINKYSEPLTRDEQEDICCYWDEDLDLDDIGKNVAGV